MKRAASRSSIYIYFSRVGRVEIEGESESDEGEESGSSSACSVSVQKPNQRHTARNDSRDFPSDLA